ncbi:hypothetical protein IMG5_143480 [Ichthyophthirius multifiliis]|uniref:Arrestin C-terminal-like domain-containing protein n=1 Tax=Ichthyophthirius multifiliis TaxID=5932 RepID=G0QXK0_ICHMU|nr:hypothetical protein IMG5_143480 [Ichthyophthirius multifiliis]EGR30054.1 hypothetical protein IMG5_143480 [Ichthyophthirius multifiliis]|eukprot:XP_004031290.1 hypothetical protein IMG5_143480 [Ichthyophthirius multifiliis]
MGSIQSQDAAGQIYIQTDQSFYIAGDTVTGKVYVNLQQNFPSNIVNLKIKGYEHSDWSERHQRTVSYQENGQSKTRTENYYTYHKGRNTFFCHNFPLYSWQDCSFMPAGQYTFPFQFILYNHLPGTYHENGSYQNIQYKSNIKYKVKAEIISGKRKIKDKQYLVIREPLKNLVQAQYGEGTVKPTTCCCISQGTSVIRCHFDRNSYCPGETAYILADIDNSECDLAVKSLECTFKKILKLKSDSGHETVIIKIIQIRDFPGCPARQTAMNENRRQASIQLLAENGTLIQPSTKGQLVNCQYQLKVECKLEGCTCCSNVPDVEVPICLVSPPAIGYGQVQAPVNWNPQVYDVKNVVFSNDYMYAQQAPINNMGGMNMQYPQMNNNNQIPYQQQNYQPQPLSSQQQPFQQPSQQQQCYQPYANDYSAPQAQINGTQQQLIQ